VRNSGNWNDVSTSHILINGRPTRTFSGWSHLLLHACTNVYLQPGQSDNNLLPAVAGDLCTVRRPLCHSVSTANQLRQRNVIRGKLTLFLVVKLPACHESRTLNVVFRISPKLAPVLDHTLTPQFFNIHFRIQFPSISRCVEGIRGDPCVAVR